MKSADPQTRIFIVPTRQGFAYAIWTIIILILGVVNGNHALLGVVAFLVTLGLLTMHLTHLNLARLQVKNVELSSGFAGERADLRIKTKNPLDTPLVSVQFEGQVVNVPIGERWIQNLSLPLQTRGIKKVDSIKIASTYPLGFFYAWTYWEGEAKAFVYPMRDPSLNVQPTQISSDAKGFGPESEFAGHRSAAVGDSARRLNWKVFSKTQKLYFKLYDRESEEPLILKWALPESASALDTEEKLRHFSSSIDACRKIQRPIGLILPDQEFHASTGEEHYLKCLQSLAVF